MAQNHGNIRAMRKKMRCQQKVSVLIEKSLTVNDQN
jgi:hypothetical protein